MNFVRNFVTSIPRVNLHLTTGLRVKYVEQKVSLIKSDNIFIKENIKQNIKENNADIDIDKLDNDYLTLKSIEHAIKN